LTTVSAPTIRGLEGLDVLVRPRGGEARMPRRHARTPAPATPGPAPARQATTPNAETAQAARDDPLLRVAPGQRGVLGAQAQAAALHQASGGRLARAGHALLQLQRQSGNRYVQQVVRHARQAA